MKDWKNIFDNKLRRMLNDAYYFGKIGQENNRVSDLEIEKFRQSVVKQAKLEAIKEFEELITEDIDGVRISRRDVGLLKERIQEFI